MMATLEQVEKLKARANVSFEEARNALNACNGDLLDALIYLERQGKTEAPGSGGYYSSEDAEIVTCEQQSGNGGNNSKKTKANAESAGWRDFKSFMGKIGGVLLKIIEIANTNSIEVWRDGTKVFTLPLSVFILLLILAFWSVIPLMVVGLFFKFRYRFSGPELGKDSINDAMDSAADAADATAESFRNSYKEHQKTESYKESTVEDDKKDEKN